MSFSKTELLEAILAELLLQTSVLVADLKDRHEDLDNELIIDTIKTSRRNLLKAIQGETNWPEDV